VQTTRRALALVVLAGATWGSASSLARAQPDPDFVARRAEMIRTTPVTLRSLEGYGLEIALSDDVVLPTSTSVDGAMYLQSNVACSVQITIDPPFTTPHQAIAEDLTVAGSELEHAEHATTADGWRLVADLRFTDGGGRTQSFSKLTVLRRVGATPIACSGEAACVDWMCADLRAVPGGPAATRHRTAPPAISIYERGGQGHFAGRTDVWRDGLVRHAGPRCKTWRERESSIDPASVRSAVTALTDLRGVDRTRTSGCADCGETMVRVRAGFHRDFFRFSYGDPPAMERALAAVRAAVGANPCQ
jgi:hypothetical protein